MSKTQNIISIIDTEISNGFYFKGVKFHGFAELINKDEQVFAGSLNGLKYNQVGFDNRSPMNVYHRQLDHNIDVDSENGFGRKALATETFNMTCVVFAANQNKIKNATHELNTKFAEEFAQLFPVRFTKSQLSTLDVRSGLVNVTGTDVNKIRVFGEELNETKFVLKPQSVLFKINYSVVLKYLTDCATITCE